MPANGELPVLPMTTLDEVTYRTPDALFNGSAVVSVIQSCVPNIKNAWGMPSMDIDTILVAIRIATYGHELDMSTECPACATEADYGVDLRTVIDQIKAPDYQTTRLTQLSNVLKKITAITTNALAQNISLVKTPQAQVTDYNHITEWLSNCDRDTFSKVRDHIVGVKQRGELQPLDLKCQNCDHEYKQIFTLDMTNFFGVAS